MGIVSDRIVELVNEAWGAGRPMLISELGTKLRRQFSIPQLNDEFRGQKLLSFIRENLDGLILPVQDPSNEIVWALAPAGIYVDETALFERIKKPPLRSTDPTKIRYDRALWRAFSSELQPDTRRYIELGETVQVRDLPANMPPPLGCVLIPTDELLPTDELPQFGSVPTHQWQDHVAGRIEEWADKNEVDLRPYKRSGSAHRSVLDLVLEAIPNEELKLISFPLHIVKILNARKI